MSQLQCPHCQQELRVKTMPAPGTMVRCFQCQQPFQVPELVTTFQVTCPHCWKGLKVKERPAPGAAVRCYGCHKPFIVRAGDIAATTAAKPALGSAIHRQAPKPAPSHPPSPTPEPDPRPPVPEPTVPVADPFADLAPKAASFVPSTPDPFAGLPDLPVAPPAVKDPFALEPLAADPWAGQPPGLAPPPLNRNRWNLTPVTWAMIGVGCVVALMLVYVTALMFGRLFETAVASVPVSAPSLPPIQPPMPYRPLPSSGVGLGGVGSGNDNVSPFAPPITPPPTSSGTNSPLPPQPRIPPPASAPATETLAYKIKPGQSFLYNVNVLHTGPLVMQFSTELTIACRQSDDSERSQAAASGFDLSTAAFCDSRINAGLFRQSSPCVISERGEFYALGKEQALLGGMSIPQLIIDELPPERILDWVTGKTTEWICQRRAEMPVKNFDGRNLTEVSIPISYHVQYKLEEKNGNLVTIHKSYVTEKITTPHGSMESMGEGSFIFDLARGCPISGKVESEVSQIVQDKLRAIKMTATYTLRR